MGLGRLVGLFGAGFVAFSLVACGDPAGADRDRALALALQSSAGEARAGQTLRVHPLPLEGAAAHRAQMRTVYRVGGGDDVRILTIERTVERDTERRWRLEQARHYVAPNLPHAPEGGLQDGRQGRFDGVAFASRRAGGPWISHAEADDGERWLNEAFGDLDSVIAAFDGAIEWTPDPSRDPGIVGLRVRWARASLDPQWVAPVIEGASRKSLAAQSGGFSQWMQAGHRLKTVTGVVAFRVTDAGELDLTRPVSGSLTLAGDAATEAGSRLPFALETERRLEPLAGDPDFELPAGVMSAKRPRPWRMIKSVLGDTLRSEFDRIP